MARPLRIEYAGAFYHIMARGNNKADIFLDDHDRETFIASLGYVCKHFHWSVWAWCLMGNHYHLLVETREPTLSAGMRDLNGMYARRFNDRHTRVGHVFQGRFNAPLVDREGYLLTALRYIVLNPVKAGLTNTAGAWRWSSHRATMGWESAPGWLAVTQTLGLFHYDLAAARRAYAQYVAAGVGADSDYDFPRTGFVGDEAFIELVAAKVKDSRFSAEIMRNTRPTSTLVAIANGSATRDEAIRAAYATAAYSLTEIGEHFGLHRTTVSRIVGGRGQVEIRASRTAEMRRDGSKRRFQPKPHARIST